MSQIYIAEAGDDLFTIAGRFGFADEKALLSANQDLMSHRKANLLYPGDKVTIPEKKPGSYSASEKKTNTFVLKAPVRTLKLSLKDGKGAARSGCKYVLTVGADSIEGTTDASGKIEAELSWKVTTATLTLEDGASCELRIGELNPMGATLDGGASGAAQRLLLLGYDPGATDGSEPEVLESAMIAYAEATDADPDGILTPSFMDALNDATTR
jgi:hypothetical protein